MHCASDCLAPVLAMRLTGALLFLFAHLLSFHSSAVKNYKFKAKIVPGTSKKGKGACVAAQTRLLPPSPGFHPLTLFLLALRCSRSRNHSQFQHGCGHCAPRRRAAQGHQGERTLFGGRGAGPGAGPVARMANAARAAFIFIPFCFPQDEELFRSVPGKIKVMSMAQTARRGKKK